MQPAIRDYYRLEELWGDKPVKMKIDGEARPLAALPAPAKARAGKPAAPKRTVAKAAAAKKTAGKKPVRKAGAAKKASPPRKPARPTRAR